MSLSEDLVLKGAVTFTGSEKVKKEGRVRTGWDEREGPQWSGPGLECSIEVWCFDGKLWQSWANCSNSGSKRGPGPDQTMEKANAGREGGPQGSWTDRRLLL